MMNEDQLKLEARLIAIEYMLANVYGVASTPVWESSRSYGFTVGHFLFLSS